MDNSKLIPSEERLESWKKFQEENYSENAEKERNRTREENIIQILERVSPDAEKVYEFGCGSGHLAKRLVDRGYDAYGYDLPEVTSRCRDQFPDIRDRFRNHDFTPRYWAGEVSGTGIFSTATRWTHGEADVVIAVELVEHLPHDLLFLQLSRQVAPKIVLAVPVGSEITPDDHHLRHYPGASIEKLLRLAGYRKTERWRNDASLYVYGEG